MSNEVPGTSLEKLKCALRLLGCYVANCQSSETLKVVRDNRDGLVYIAAHVRESIVDMLEACPDFKLLVEPDCVELKIVRTHFSAFLQLPMSPGFLLDPEDQFGLVDPLQDEVRALFPFLEGYIAGCQRDGILDGMRSERDGIIYLATDLSRFVGMLRSHSRFGSLVRGMIECHNIPGFGIRLSWADGQDQERLEGVFKSLTEALEGGKESP